MPAALDLPRVTCGARAVEVIADRAAAIAALNETTAEALLKLLRSDPTACIDRTGRLLYIDPPPR